MGTTIPGWKIARRATEDSLCALYGSNTVVMGRKGVLIIGVLYRWKYPRRQEAILGDHTIVVSLRLFTFI